jgi:hypothetical protein
MKHIGIIRFALMVIALCTLAASIQQGSNPQQNIVAEEGGGPKPGGG